MTIPADRLAGLGALAARLAEAWQAAGEIAPPRPQDLPADRAEAYAVQDMMAEALAVPVTGWKLGATSARMREIDGHDDVIPGRILEPTTYAGAQQTLPIVRFPDARVETEFAFRLTAELPPRDRPWQPEDLAPLVVLHPAIEIIGNRYPKGPGAIRVGTLETIADNGGGIGFVFGDPVRDWQDIDFRQHRIALSVVDSGPEAENFLGELRCEPIEAVADLANHLAARGLALKAGDYVSTGAATVPQPVAAGSRVLADFGALGRIELAFE